MSERDLVILFGAALLFTIVAVLTLRDPEPHCAAGYKLHDVSGPAWYCTKDRAREK